MNEELKPLLDLLGGNGAIITTIAAWVFALRILAKPISGWIQNLFTKLVLFVTGTPEADDDVFVTGLLKSKIYRTLAFLVDLLASIKLPNSESLAKVQAEEKQ